jgi:multidrug efflux pump subunit AcrA (membrane-fusion protein)
MQRNPKILIPVFVILVVAAAAAAFYILQTSSQANGTTVSGTIEATEVHLGTQMGGLVNQVYVNEGDSVQAGQVVAEVQPASGVSAGYTEKIRTPLAGVVLERDLEPGEIALPGSTLITVGDLTRLTLTVYVPEDRYGQINLEQEYPVAVDSFPGRNFSGKVTYISDQAEFTPRNVQTVQGRKATVYAVRLSLDNPDLALKPGMPADVNLEIK